MKVTREAKIGIVGIIALIMLFFTIKFLQGVNVFSSSDTYYINFRNAKGLAKSSPVYADGFQVGIVSNLYYDYKRPGTGVIVTISVDPGMRVPKGTVATLDEAMLGGCTLNLMMGNSPVERYAEGDTIPSADNNGLMARAAQIMPQVEATLAKVDTLLTTLNTLASDPNLRAILANTNQLTASLNQSAEELHSLMEKDIPAMTKTFQAAGQNVADLTANLKQWDVQSTMAKVDTTMAGLQLVTQKLNSPDNNVGLLLNDSSLYNNLNQTSVNAASLLEDFKAHPKRYIHFSVFGKKDK